MAQAVSDAAAAELQRIEAHLTVTAPPQVVADFRVCKSNLAASVDRICHHPLPGYPGNVAVTTDPFFVRHTRRRSDSVFVTYNRLEAEFLDRLDPRTHGRVAVVVGYHYEW